MPDELRFNTPYLNHYLKMVEETESPRIFHIWAAIASLASALGRRNFFPFGHGVIYPNQYILLVGTPGTRKSTVLKIMKRNLAKSTGVHFAPDDTAGQRQGLIQTMLENSAEVQLYVDGVKLNDRDDSLAALTLQEFAGASDESPDDAQREIDEADKQHLVATSDEFSRFIGQNNLTMLDFLTSTWDGESYMYKTLNKSVTLKAPLLNLLGCTTPVSLNNAMPAAAGGQGFLSRMILVYGSRKYKLIPRPAPPPLDHVHAVQDQLEEIGNMMYGGFEETTEARSYSETLYNQPLDITDARFSYYHERRYTHLIKTAMALAAGRGDHTIVKDDYVEANRILKATERGMPDALGEFGMSPLAALKQGILEFMRNTGAIPLDALRAQFHRDSRANEFTEAINDLTATNHIGLSQVASGHTVVSAKLRRDDTEDAIMNLLAEA